MEIIDLTNNSKPRELKPIEFISCLQRNKTATPDIYLKSESEEEKRSFYFYNDGQRWEPHPSFTKKIVRLTQISNEDGVFDLIGVYMGEDHYPYIFLGHWNDGVVNNN